MKVRAHVYISGLVQGVFFRSATRREARKHGVTGWVRNLPDGRVEAVFEGEEAAVKNLVEFCKHGPTGAIVKSVEVKWTDYKGEFESFEIRY
ncbi:MAG: acylphosphatase [Candidatus Bathyarchaeota archaeon]|nr:acylphosphatase [Candidatus Bathyarchaeota archaeon]MCX8177352.1 acylphosphatase [Candidatus Bathyarchaeota archaeon]MDW8193798.1 acylphosphatase [Nitrososphaerota archaeon]